MADIENLAEQIVGLTLLEAAQLKDLLKDKYGIEPAAGGAVMMAGPAAGGGAAAAARRRRRSSTSSCVEAGDKKINVIKEVRAITVARPQGGEGSGRGRRQGRQGGRLQGRGREHQEEA